MSGNALRGKEKKYQNMMQLLERLLKRGQKMTISRFYFGTRGTCIVGGVYAPERPDLHFRVALIDDQGNEVAFAVADGPSARESIPGGYGFTLAVPSDWLRPRENARTFQIRICATGEVFPKIPPTLPRIRMLKSMGLNLRDANQGPLQFARVLQHLESRQPVGENDLLVAVTHELTRKGCP